MQVLYIVGTAVYQRQTRRLRSHCGRRNGISLLSRLLKCILVSGVGREGLMSVRIPHKQTTLFTVTVL